MITNVTLFIFFILLFVLNLCIASHINSETVINNNQKGRKILEEAIIIFDEVNAKIDGLVDCSVKDFELLNSNFKKYYINLQKLSNISNGLATLILKFNANPQFQILVIANTNQKEKFFESITVQLTQLNELSSSFSLFQLLLNNIKQDLSTIRLLITNLRFDPIISADYNSLNNSLDSLLHCLQQQEKNAGQASTALNKAIKFIEEEIYFNTELLSEQIEKINSALVYLSELNEPTQKHQKKLADLERKKASSTSEIITNLQFQDILRQQIEHVQHAHVELTLNLKNSHREGDSLSEDELYKIRDINTLQSAQLINSNREYQKAVETILHKICELSSFLNQYNSLWNQFFKPQGIKLEQLKSGIHEHTSNLVSRKFSLNHLNAGFSQLLIEIDKEINNFKAHHKKSNTLCLDIGFIQEFIDKIEISHLRNKEQNPVIQIKNELNKINSALLKFNEVFNASLSDSLFIGNIIKERLQTDIELIDSYSNIIIELNSEIQNLFASGFDTNIRLEETADFSVDKINYYKKFEKEVQEIIKLLDNLLQSINLGRSTVDSQQLEHLKDMYTMENERKIHRMVTGAKENSKKKKSDNDIEFF